MSTIVLFILLCIFYFAVFKLFDRLWCAVKARRSAAKTRPKSAKRVDSRTWEPRAGKVQDEPKIRDVAENSEPKTRVDPREKSEVIVGAAYVTDGDGLRIKGEEIRLFGIDAPEFNHPYGRKAKSELIGLCLRQLVRAEVKERDHFGRIVAKCTLPDGRDLSAEMVKAGLAIDWPKYSDGAYTHLETVDARKKLWLADARQKARMHVWDRFEARQAKAA